jgi:DNA replication protein DnaC
MKTIDGLSVTDHCKDAYSRRLRQGQRVDVYPLESKQTDPLERCSNCNGHEQVMMQTILEGPSDEPVFKTGWTYLKDGYYKVDYRFFPCPICQSIGNQVAQELLNDSGLLESEHEWSMLFYQGKGKEDALALIRPFASLQVPVGMLYLYGEYGMGKTGILKALVAGFCRDGIKAKYIRAADFITEAQATFNAKDEDSAASVLYKYSRYAVLAVDEIDRVSGGEWSQSFLFQLLDRRYERRDLLATLLASNQDIANNTQYGYLASRLTDGIRVRVAGQSLRGEVVA